jgi:hypothetical protein
MFSPDAATRPSQGTSTRNPRRRRRDGSESVMQQAPRKRSKLTDDTFVPPPEAQVNGNGTIIANGKIDRDDSPSHLVDMPVREKKRNAKGDGSSVLVSYNFGSDLSMALGRCANDCGVECRRRARTTFSDTSATCPTV